MGTVPQSEQQLQPNDTKTEALGGGGGAHFESTNLKQRIMESSISRLVNADKMYIWRKLRWSNINTLYM
jgi:hypothetical protein